jgi:hypothetical protein
MPDSPVRWLPPIRLRRDGGTFARARLNEETVEHYRTLITGPPEMDMPAVIAFLEETDHWLADGHHRTEAYLREGRPLIPVDLRTGTLRDARLYAASANALHGLQRTDADRRAAVSILLDDPECAKWPHMRIAQHCGVSDFLVRTMRREREEQGTDQILSGQGQRPAQGGPKIDALESRRRASHKCWLRALEAADQAADLEAIRELAHAALDEDVPDDEWFRRMARKLAHASLDEDLPDSEWFRRAARRLGRPPLVKGADAGLADDTAGG